MSKRRHNWFVDPDAICGVDPDFDDLGGELTLEQIRHPVLSLAQSYKTPAGDGDPDGLTKKWKRQQRQALNQKWWRLRQISSRWDRLAKRLIKDLMAWRKRRLEDLSQRLTAVASPKAQLMRKQAVLQALSQRLAAAPDYKAQIERKQLNLWTLSQRFLHAQLKDYPAFPWTGKCQRCVPYNGRFTVNYWATGQKDPW